MVSGWRPVVIPEEIYEVAQKHHEEQKEEPKLKNGVRSLTGFINFCIREYVKEQGVIRRFDSPLVFTQFFRR